MKERKKKFSQPERKETDGPMSVRWLDDDRRVLEISVTNGDKVEAITMSAYNAWRVFGCMAFMLELPLRKDVEASISLGKGGGEVTFVRPAAKTFGERVAAHLADQLFLEEMQKYGLEVKRKPI